MKKTSRVTLVVALMAILLLQACSAEPRDTAAPVPLATESPAPAVTQPPSPKPSQDPTAALSETPSPSPTPEPTARPGPTPFTEEGAPQFVALYDRRSRKLVSGLASKWTKGKDIIEVFVLPSLKESVEKSSAKVLVEKYWHDYRAMGYRIGYRVSITLESGETIVLHIRSPKDAPPDATAKHFKYVEIYMYDSAQQDPSGDYGTWHLREQRMKKTTLIAKIKLHAGKKISEVKSINLQAFVYKGKNDFDPETGEYTGPVNYEIAINRTN